MLALPTGSMPRSIMPGRLGRWLILCGCLGVGSPTLAQAPGGPAQTSELRAGHSADAAYERLVRDAISAHEAGQHAQARRLLVEAHALRPNARTLRGMGVAAFHTGQYVEAIAEL